MSKNTGGPAFPGIETVVTGIDSEGIERVDTEASGGMTLRDYFAAKTLSSILAQRDCGINALTPDDVYSATHGESAAELWARHAYEIADAMLAARAK